MKRFLVVLTILVLVAGFAFAAVSGSVEAKYRFDFKNDDALAGYGVWGASSEVEFTLTTESVKSEGSNKPYATVTVDLGISADVAERKNAVITPNSDGEYILVGGGALSASLKLSDFRIVGENWEINFLKALVVGDYAKSAWEVYTDGNNKKALDMDWKFANGTGITFTYDGFKIGVHAARSNASGDQTGFDPETVLDFRAESKELAVAEGVTLQAAAVIGYSKKMSQSEATVNYGFSVKGAYASDAVSVSAAADFQNYGKKFDADAALKIEVAPVTVDAYYATEVKTSADRYVSKENILSARAIVDVEKIAENVPLKVTLYGENLLNEDRVLAIKEEGKFGKFSEDAQFGIIPSIEDTNYWFVNGGVGYEVAEKFTVDAHFGMEKLTIDDFYIGAYAIKLGAGYDFDIAKLEAGAYLGKIFMEEEVEDFTDLRFACEIKASSDKIVDNALISATLHLDKYSVIALYDATRAVDKYNSQPAYDSSKAGMYLELGCKVSF